MFRCVIVFFLISLFSYKIIAQPDQIGSGRAIQFDGIDDLIDLGNVYDDLQLPVTVTAWIYLDPSASGTMPIFMSQDNLPLYNGVIFHCTPSLIAIEYGDGRGENSVAFRRSKVSLIPNGFNLLEKWVHVVGIMRGPTDMDIFLNGINLPGTYSGGTTFPMSSNSPGDVAKIGRCATNGSVFNFKGMIDEITLWNKALSQTEVRENMCKRLAGNEPGLIGYWNFDETSDNLISDKSSNGFHGQLRNDPVRVYSGAPIGDESIFSYQSNWTGTVLTETEGLQTVEVSNINGSPQGVHIYTVKSKPSQISGLNVTPIPDVYFGVFCAANDLNNSFDVKHTDNQGTCGISNRNNNSISTWSNPESSLTGVSERTELILQGTQNNLKINLGADEMICPFVPKTLSPLSNPNGFEFTWHDGSKQSTYTASDYGTYWVTVENDCSVSTDTIHITKHVLEEVTLPNVISPNGDQWNQFFIVSDNLLGSQLYVYNRWGKQVYSSLNYQNDWDGTSLSSGVYYFLITGECINEQKGWISIVR